MVLRCPRCSELRFFGRTQLMGELVVCPKCEAVFGWRDSAPVKSPRDSAPVAKPPMERKSNRD